MGGCKGSGVSVLIGDVEGITDEGIMAGSSFQVERCAAHPQMPGILSALGGNIQLMLISCSHHATLGLSAISSGVVEGFEGSVSTLAGAGNPYELVKKVAETNHLIATRWLFISEDCWNTIPEKYQKIIEDCAYECGMWEQTSCEDDEATQIEFLKSQGVTWNEVDLDAFSKACEPVIDWIVEEYGSTYEAYDELKGLVAEYRANNA